MTKQTKSRGFTIVELLIVIVIIAILAAITIVAYNGITARANTTSAKAAANAAVKKIEAYNSDASAGIYPAYPSLLTSAPSTATYQLTGVSFSDNATAPTTAPTGPSVLLFYACSAGARVDYWDYTSAASNKWTAMYTGGGTSGTCTSYKRATATS